MKSLIKNVKVEHLNNMFLSRGEEKGLIVKDPLFRIGMDKYDINNNLYNCYGSLRSA